MLHVEQPDASRSGHHVHQHLQQQIRLKAEDPTHPGSHHQDRQIRPSHRVPLPPGRLGRRKSLHDEKHEQGSEAEQHHRIPRQPISEALPARGLQVFLHRQGPHVANPAPVQVTRRGVMQGMFPAPMKIGRECERAGDEAHDVIGLARGEERAVAAVVENDKHPHQKPRGQHGQRQRQPHGHSQAEIHQAPQRRVRNQRVHQLPDARPHLGLLVFGHNVLPGRRIGAAFGLG